MGLDGTVNTSRVIQERQRRAAQREGLNLLGQVRELGPDATPQQKKALLDAIVKAERKSKPHAWESQSPETE